MNSFQWFLDLVKWFLTLQPRVLNIALLLFAVGGMIWVDQTNRKTIIELRTEVKINNILYTRKIDSLIVRAERKEEECNDKLAKKDADILRRVEEFQEKYNAAMDRRDQVDKTKKVLINATITEASRASKELKKLNHGIKQNISN